MYRCRRVRAAGRGHDREPARLPGGRGGRHVAPASQPCTHGFHTPWIAIITFAELTLLLALSGGFKALAVLASMALLLTYLAVCLAALKIRYAGRERRGASAHPAARRGTARLGGRDLGAGALDQEGNASMAALVAVAVLYYFLRRNAASPGASLVADPLPRLAAALADRYRIERELGAGGMATVYLAAGPEARPQGRDQGPEARTRGRARRRAVRAGDQDHGGAAASAHPAAVRLRRRPTASCTTSCPTSTGETLREKLNRETQLGVDEAVRIAGRWPTRSTTRTGTA